MDNIKSFGEVIDNIVDNALRKVHEQEDYSPQVLANYLKVELFPVFENLETSILSLEIMLACFKDITLELAESYIAPGSISSQDLSTEINEEYEDIINKFNLCSNMSYSKVMDLLLLVEVGKSINTYIHSLDLENASTINPSIVRIKNLLNNIDFSKYKDA